MLSVTNPGEYIRKSFVLNDIGKYAKKFGKSSILIGGETALSITKNTIINSLEENQIEALATFHYGGESSWTNIHHLIKKVKETNPEFLIGIGGGKALDTAKAVAFATNLPLIAVPTIAATCAACTAISIIYAEDGTFIEISHKSKAPNLVLVDLEILMNAPTRFLIAGIGDTLAKWFEARASVQKVRPNALNRSALKLAENIYQILHQESKDAIASVEKNDSSESFIHVVDCIIYLSGIVSSLGGDDCRTAGAHAIYSGLTIFPEVHQSYHGEIVAYGILVQLAMEGKAKEEILGLIDFYKSVNLPYQLSHMGLIDLNQKQLQKLGEISITIEDMENMPFDVTPELVVSAIQTIEAIGKKEIRYGA